MEKSDDKAGKIKEYFKIFMHKKMDENFKDLNEQVMKVESDPEKLKKAEEERKNNLEKTKEIRELTGEKKE